MGTALLDIYMQYKHITEHFTSYSDVMRQKGKDSYLCFCNVFIQTLCIVVYVQ